MTKVYLGIDVGSVSTNVVAINEDSEVISKQYIRTNGQPIESVKTGLSNLKDKLKNLEVLGVGTTGSGRYLTGLAIGADLVKNEITAHATATIFFYPEAKTVFEIGGQDSKIIILRDGMIVDFAMNTVCAAGTGSFLDHQSTRLGIPIEQFGDLALSSIKNVRIAGRCTVFAESDMIAKQQYGFLKADIIKGLCEALVRNYINNLGRGKPFEPPFVFQGGVAANKGIVASFKKELASDILVPEHFDVMGAIGIAVLTKDYIRKAQHKSKFRGFNATNIQFTQNIFECNGCSNLCEVVKINIADTTVAMLGDKCGKWTNNFNSTID